ncbi:hypothetical protein FACS1894176_11310 [Bacteroidia bacterium]|nr:hypothetical protein FACS1894176_11310 [Bacteroidia bacterium]
MKALFLPILPLEFLQIREQAKNFIKYLKTKFFRILVSAIKITQSAPKRVYRFVPLQDFNEEWTDEKLYDKYNLSPEERNFINNNRYKRLGRCYF